MRKSDYLFLLVVVILFLPFLLSPELYAGYKAFNAAHGMVMSFLSLQFYPCWVSVWDCGSVPVFTIVRDLVSSRAW